MELARRWLDDVRRCAAALALASVAFSASAAEPEAAGAPTAAEKDTARALARDGDALFAERQFEPALARYSAAYHLVRVPTLGVQVAKTQAELGRVLEALRTAREVENMAVQPGEPSVFAAARRNAKELSRELGVRVPRIVIEVTPKNAVPTVSIDGTPAPAATSDTGAELEPGVHHLRVSAEGYSNVELEFELRERDRESLPVTLFPKAGSKTANPARAGAAPSTSVAAVAAPAAAPSGEDERRDRAAAARSARTRGYVALSVAGVGAAAGTVTGVLAFSTKPDCPDDTCALSQSDDIDTSKRYGNIATVSFAVGGAALLYGLWELLANGDDDAETASGPLRVAVTPGADGGVLVVGTSF